MKESIYIPTPIYKDDSALGVVSKHVLVNDEDYNPTNLGKDYMIEEDDVILVNIAVASIIIATYLKRTTCAIDSQKKKLLLEGEKAFRVIRPWNPTAPVEREGGIITTPERNWSDDSHLTAYETEKVVQPTIKPRLKNNDKKRWDDKEEDVIRDKQYKTYFDLLEALPHRSYTAIETKCSALNVCRKGKYEHRGWTDDETEFLKDNIQELTLEDFAILFERNHAGILAHQRTFGFKQVSLRGRKIRKIRENVKDVA